MEIFRRKRRQADEDLHRQRQSCGRGGRLRRRRRRRHAAKEKSNDSGEEGKEKPTPTKNSALFGDEDSDSSFEDEGEFKGNDDGIVGCQGSNKSKAPVQGRSMNEKLGEQFQDVFFHR